MATYKLIQDIEAEDHILGPLTLRQFIFALVGAFFYYLSFLVLTTVGPVLLIVFLPPALLMTFFAFPFGKDQPTEVWALAKLRFLFKPRKRIWDQDGMKELVTITVPKKVEHVYTDGLSQTEVRSRLQALANTIDSRGWAVKNVNVNSYAYADPAMQQQSDRLLDASALPQDVPSYSIQASDDILDERNNPIAQQFDHMITESSQAHRQQIMQQMNAPASAAAVQPTAGQGQQSQVAQPAADYWFMNGTPDPAAAQSTLPAPIAGQATPEEEALALQLKAQHNMPEASYAHMRTLQPDAPIAVAPQPAPATQVPVAPAMTDYPDPAILSLANNNDLNVSTLAREASKAKHGNDPHDEVVISLR